MTRRRRRWFGWLGIALLLAACARPDGETPEGGLALRFEDRPDPEAFERETVAVRDDPDGAAGLWATVPDLPRPERAEITRLEGRRTRVTVALFAGRGGAEDPIRVSNEASDALRLGDDPVRVRVTALRQQAEVKFNPR